MEIDKTKVTNEHIGQPLSNQRDFQLKEKAFEIFERQLNAEPQAIEGMQKLFCRNAPWE